jgi:leader peptidase (prepilin peptidase)/N-methyltransferase
MGALIVVFFTYLVLLPVGEMIVNAIGPKSKRAIMVSTDMTLWQLVQLKIIEGLTAFWFFFFGATMGSFLNVVVYRLPLGRSVVFERSSCPSCGQKILGRDNIPIFGWLLLHGKCRACNVPIPVRYPLIELLTGCVFLALYFIELISGGINLPFRQPNTYAGPVWIIFYTKWDLVSIYLYHCTLYCLLMTIALVEFDEKKLSLRTLLALAAILIIPPCLSPHLQLVKTPFTGGSGFLVNRGNSIGALAVGAFAGYLLSQSIEWARTRRTRASQSMWVAGSTYIGMVLGWQAALTIVSVTACLVGLFGIASRYCEKRQIPVTAILSAVCLSYHFGWKWIATVMLRANVSLGGLDRFWLP